MNAETITATATLLAVTHELLVDWPDMANRSDQPFKPAKAEVRKYLRNDLSENVYVMVVGAAILKDGSEGRSNRYQSFTVTGVPTVWQPGAPDWMLKSLRNAGVTW